MAQPGVCRDQGRRTGVDVIKPKGLAPGDKIAAVSASWGGPAAFPHRYEAGKRFLESEFGLEVMATRHALRSPDWLARNPKARAEDLMEAFADPSVKGIVSTIGGDDSIRILPWLDLAIIRSNPKVFLGYSDTTVAHWACLKAGLVSFYGPAIMAGFAEQGGMAPYGIESVRKALFIPEAMGRVEPNGEGWAVERLDWGRPELQSRRRKLEAPLPWRFLQGSGAVEGRLVGGCLEVVDWLRGTDIWPDAELWEGAILFLESSEEAPPPHQVARVMRCLAAMGVLHRLSGMLWGRPGGGIPLAAFDEQEEAIRSVVVGEEGLHDLPIVTRMDFGHTDPMFVLPLGIRARIDCGRRSFEILEGAVEAG